QLPLVAVRCAVVDVDHVGGGHAVGVRLQGIVGQRRQATHAALATVETPGLAGGQHLVEAVLYHQRRTGQLGRRGDLVLVVVEDVVQIARGHAFAVVDEVDFPIEFEQVVAAVGQHRRLVGDHAQLLATVAGDVVPDDFQAILRDGKGHAGRGAFDAVTAGDQLRPGGVLTGGGVQPFRNRRTAPARVNAHAVVGIKGQQALHAFRQLVAVVVQVVLVDDQQRLVSGIGINM